MNASSPNPISIEEIVELIRRLTPAQRRVLMRRLSVSGLLQPDALITDRRRLLIAPALGAVGLAQFRKASGSRRTSSPAGASLSTSAQVQAPSERQPGRGPGKEPVIRGHAVLGAPRRAPAESAPHQMQPLPGQAPEQPIVIVLRGLTLKSGEAASAEYLLRWPGDSSQTIQVRFAGQPTPAQALYDTLEKAVRAMLSRLEESGADPATARIEIYCPSDQMIDELIGEAPVADARLQTRHDRISALLNRFGEWRLLRVGNV